MDFGELRSGLDTHTLEVLTGVFDGAWTELQESSGPGIDDEVSAREMLGRRIIAAAIKLGAREPETLKRMVLEGLRH